jgi:hypothetical protein
LFVASLITQALTSKLDTFDRENAHLRVVAQKVECPYGHRASNGACILGYPGCACMDDLIVLTTFSPADERPAEERLKRRIAVLERRLLNALRRLKMASDHLQSLAAGFQQTRESAKAAAVRSMANLMSDPL